MTQAIAHTTFSTHLLLTEGGRLAKILWLAQTR